MRTLKALKPGQAGTEALLARSGRSLLCVRDRSDEATREGVKTGELIVRRSSRRPDELDPDYAAYVDYRYQQLLDGSHPHARLDRQKTALPDRQKTALSGRR